MKTLSRSPSAQILLEWASLADLNVAPDPTIYLPNVRITPAGPAPYWNIVTVPELHQYNCIRP